MTLRSETPPPPANLPADPPPDSEAPTAAQLKGDIDSGRTADKTPHMDIGAAPLGTCEEAGGTPPTPREPARPRRSTTSTGGPDRPAERAGALGAGGQGLPASAAALGPAALRRHHRRGRRGARPRALADALTAALTDALTVRPGWDRAGAILAQDGTVAAEAV